MTVLLSLINIGSSVALLAIVTLTIGALMASYIVVIGCVLLKRLRKEPLPTGRWSLGRYSIFVNICVSVIFDADVRLPIFSRS